MTSLLLHQSLPTPTPHPTQPHPTPPHTHTHTHPYPTHTPCHTQSRMMQRPGGASGSTALAIGWEVELPVLDPASLLLVAVFLQPRKGAAGD